MEKRNFIKLKMTKFTKSTCGRRKSKKLKKKLYVDETDQNKIEKN